MLPCSSALNSEYSRNWTAATLFQMSLYARAVPHRCTTAASVSLAKHDTGDVRLPRPAWTLHLRMLPATVAADTTAHSASQHNSRKRQRENFCSTKSFARAAAQQCASKQGADAPSLRPSLPALARENQSLPQVASHTSMGQSSFPGKQLASSDSPRLRTVRSCATKTAKQSVQGSLDELDLELGDAEATQQRSTVRMSRLPGGKVVNGRPSPGFVLLRSGKRIACPRCEGSGWVGGGTVSASLLHVAAQHRLSQFGCSACLSALQALPASSHVADDTVRV